jgi:hypothetical protein
MAAEAKQPDPKQDPRDLVLAILVGALLSPFTGMLRALVFRLLWSWFLTPQYGEGPTLQTWFGIGVLYSLITLRRGKSEELSGSVMRRVAESVFFDLMTLGAVIIAAMLARVVWGW